MNTKYIFVTGGVVSSLGKGITAASLGNLLKARGYNVTIQKFDPYINVDPGTMNPYEHGEVFVTDDGAETDLDLGHYERFIDENLTKYNNITTGKIYQTVNQTWCRNNSGIWNNNTTVNLCRCHPKRTGCFDFPRINSLNCCTNGFTHVGCFVKGKGCNGKDSWWNLINVPI